MKRDFLIWGSIPSQKRQHSCCDPFTGGPKHLRLAACWQFKELLVCSYKDESMREIPKQAHIINKHNTTKHPPPHLLPHKDIIYMVFSHPHTANKSLRSHKKTHQYLVTQGVMQESVLLLQVRAPITAQTGNNVTLVSLVLFQPAKHTFFLFF